MGMSLSRTEWTVEMLNALPDDGMRYEVIDGELLVTPAPAFVHQTAVHELALLLGPYVKAARLTLLTAPAAVTFSQRREVQPDLLVIPRLPNGRRASRFEDVGVLLLAVEVLSPSSLRTDRHTKRWVYQQERVAEYWIVDTDARIVERWIPDAIEPQALCNLMLWQPVLTQEPLTINLGQYFRDVLDA